MSFWEEDSMKIRTFIICAILCCLLPTTSTSAQQPFQPGVISLIPYLPESYGQQVDNLLITDDDMNNVPLLKTMLNTMINSKTAQYLCNFCIWTAKITLQTGTGQFA